MNTLLFIPDTVVRGRATDTAHSTDNKYWRYYNNYHTNLLIFSSGTVFTSLADEWHK